METRVKPLLVHESSGLGQDRSNSKYVQRVSHSRPISSARGGSPYSGCATNQILAPMAEGRILEGAVQPETSRSRPTNEPVGPLPSWVLDDVINPLAEMVR